MLYEVNLNCLTPRAIYQQVDAEEASLIDMPGQHTRNAIRNMC
jgi:hypothetical protein